MPKKRIPHYHPVNKAVCVNTAATSPPGIEKTLILPKISGNKRAKPSMNELRTFHKLVGCFNILNDPFGDIVYNRQAGKRKRHFRRAEDVIHISSECGADEPKCCCCKYKKGGPPIVPTKDAVARSLIYNSPAPPLEPRKTVEDRLEKLSQENTRANTRRQYPLSSVCVRWRTAYDYSLVDLYCVMAEYGQITTIDVSSSYSAIVVFSSLSDACRAVEERTVGPRHRRLFCHWKHRSMSSRTFHYKWKGIGSSNNEMMHPTK